MVLKGQTILGHCIDGKVKKINCRNLTISYGCHQFFYKGLFCHILKDFYIWQWKHFQNVNKLVYYNEYEW